MPDQKYDRLPKAGKQKARIPRFGRLIAGISESRFNRLHSNAAVFWELLTYVSLLDNDETGLLDSGLKATKACTLGLHKDSNTERTDRVREWQATLALYMLAAIAFEMLCGERGDGASPPLDRVTNSHVKAFLDRAFKRIFAAGGYVDSLEEPLPHDHVKLDGDWECLKHMNSHGLSYNVFSDTEREILFTDISLRNFLAAYWSVRWAGDDDRSKTLHWFPDPTGDRKGDYYEYWEFTLELRELEIEDEKSPPFVEQRWCALFAPLYDRQLQTQATLPVRSTELIYRSWDRMEQSEAKLAFLGEFTRRIDDGDEVAMSVLRGQDGDSQFILLANPSGEFWMGASDEEEGYDREKPRHLVHLDRFLMHRYCVTNQQYELFDPRRCDRRSYTGEGARDVSRHPVVNVSWHDAWCFAKWIGEIEFAGESYFVGLPTEAQWEYACRCGSETPFTWGDDGDGDRITSGDCNFDSNYPWPNGDGSKAEGDARCVQRTIAVDGDDPELTVVPNPWGLHQMHGNVWEWCWDWYGPYRESAEKNPTGPDDGVARVLRGGCWFNFGWGVRSASRDIGTPGDRGGSDGFRLAAVPVSGG